MNTQADPPEPAGRPFASPCRALPLRAALRWLRLGWQDLRRAPRQSLGYGLLMLLLSYLITLLSWWLGDIGLYLGLLSGFVFLGPCLAMLVYAISRQLEQGKAASVRLGLLEIRQRLSDTMVFALILTVVFLIWARAATAVHIFFPTRGHYHWQELLAFLGIGSLVGSLFCTLVFSISAFSLPMLMDRQVDAVTAVVTSVNAVLRNKAAMLLWAGLVVSFVLIGALTAYLAYVILLPLLGHATWHAYRDSIDASDWPPAGVSTELR